MRQVLRMNGPPEALKEQLGLKLVPQLVPVEFVVIDHVDKVPVEN